MRNALELMKLKLLQNIPEGILDALKRSEAILAGGAITSTFSSTDINDYDLYFRSKEQLISFCAEIYNPNLTKEYLELVYEDIDTSKIQGFYDSTNTLYSTYERASTCNEFELVLKGITKRSVLFCSEDLKLQAISFEFVEDAHDIFKLYDFTVNMGAFDFKTMEFVLHDSFLVDLSQRVLRFNTDTRYPIISNQRVVKYLSRGYTISAKESYKISLAIQKLNLSSWDDLEDQLSGFYGLDVSKLFDKSSTFSIDGALDCIEQANYIPFEMGNTLDCFDMILESLFKKKDKLHVKTVYKVLIKDQKNEGVYTSLHYTSFKWKLGEMHNGGENGFWAWVSEEEAESNISRNDKYVIAKFEVPDSTRTEFEQGSMSVVRVHGDMKFVEIIDKK